MSYVLTGFGGLWLFLVMIVTLSPRGEYIEPAYAIAGYAVGGIITITGVVLYVLQHRKFWR